MHDACVCQDLVKRTAEREAERTADMKRADKTHYLSSVKLSSQAQRDTWRLREEREV
jgi:hypothetical protein